jgi:hemin uptake protein HemP
LLTYNYLFFNMIIENTAKVPDAVATAPQRVQSDALLGRAKELLIIHNGREHRLRQTLNGKLILTA